jgi:hypothetical protein
MTIRLYFDEDTSDADLLKQPQMRRLLRLLNALSAEDMINRLEFLGAWG